MPSNTPSRVTTLGDFYNAIEKVKAIAEKRCICYKTPRLVAELRSRDAKSYVCKALGQREGQLSSLPLDTPLPPNVADKALSMLV